MIDSITTVYLVDKPHHPFNKVSSTIKAMFTRARITEPNVHEIDVRSKSKGHKSSTNIHLPDVSWLDGRPIQFLHVSEYRTSTNSIGLKIMISGSLPAFYNPSTKSCWLRAAEVQEALMLRTLFVEYLIGCQIDKLPIIRKVELCWQTRHINNPIMHNLQNRLADSRVGGYTWYTQEGYAYANVSGASIAIYNKGLEILTKGEKRDELYSKKHDGLLRCEMRLSREKAWMRTIIDSLFNTQYELNLDVWFYAYNKHMPEYIPYIETFTDIQITESEACKILNQKGGFSLNFAKLVCLAMPNVTTWLITLLDSHKELYEKSYRFRKMLKSLTIDKESKSTMSIALKVKSIAVLQKAQQSIADRYSALAPVVYMTKHKYYSIIDSSNHMDSFEDIDTPKTWCKYKQDILPTLDDILEDYMDIGEPVT